MAEQDGWWWPPVADYAYKALLDLLDERVIHHEGTEPEPLPPTDITQAVAEHKELGHIGYVTKYGV